MNIIEATRDDINILMDLDLKSYQYPLTGKQWSKIGKRDNYCISMAIEGDQTLGFVIWQAKKQASKILRLGVKPQYRGRGAGTLLLVAYELDSLMLGCLKCSVMVPEIHCFPGHPDDVSLWLKHRGYLATSIKHGYTKMYGEKVDGIQFTKTFASP